MRRRLSLKRQITIFILVIFSVTVAILLAVVYPTFGKYEEVRQEIHAVQQQAEAEHASVARARTSIAKIDEIEKQVYQYADASVIVGSELAVITELEGLAEEHGIEQNLSASFVEPTPAQVKSGFAGEYRFSFLNHGTYENQLALLQALEALPYYLIIERVQWEGKPDNSGGAKVTLRFDALVYLMEEEM